MKSKSKEPKLKSKEPKLKPKGPLKDSKDLIEYWENDLNNMTKPDLYTLARHHKINDRSLNMSRKTKSELVKYIFEKAERRRKLATTTAEEGSTSSNSNEIELAINCNYRSCLKPLHQLAQDLKDMGSNQLEALQRSPLWNVYKPFHEGDFQIDEVDKDPGALYWILIQFFKKHFKSSPEEVAVIFGLQRIQEPGFSKTDDELNHFMKKYLLNDKGRIHKSILITKLKETAYDPSKAYEFVSILTAFLCCQVFFPTGSGQYLNRSYIQMILEPERVSWPDHIYKHLMEEIIKEDGNLRAISACTVYPMYCFAEHVKIIDRRTKYANLMPRFIRWNTFQLTKSVRKWLVEDGESSLLENWETNSFPESFNEIENGWATSQLFQETEKEPLVERENDGVTMQMSKAIDKGPQVPIEYLEFMIHFAEKLERRAVPTRDEEIQREKIKEEVSKIRQANVLSSDVTEAREDVSLPGEEERRKKDRTKFEVVKDAEHEPIHQCGDVCKKAKYCRNKKLVVLDVNGVLADVVHVDDTCVTNKLLSKGKLVSCEVDGNSVIFDENSKEIALVKNNKIIGKT